MEMRSEGSTHWYSNMKTFYKDLRVNVLGFTTKPVNWEYEKNLESVNFFRNSNLNVKVSLTWTPKKLYQNPSEIWSRHPDQIWIPLTQMKEFQVV